MISAVDKRQSIILSLLLLVIADTTFPQSTIERENLPASSFESLGEAGRGEGYTFGKVHAASNLYFVKVSGHDEGVLVSDSFLSLIHRHSGMTSETKQKALMAYPDMVADNFRAIMDSTFPDKTIFYSESFEAIECTGTNRAVMTIYQDELAAPYLRVTLRQINGSVDNFSISRRHIEDLLAQNDIDGNKLIEALQAFPFRLPELVRHGFSNYSRDQLDNVILESPELQNQEIIRIERLYRNDADNILSQASIQHPESIHTASSIVSSTVYRAAEPANNNLKQAERSTRMNNTLTSGTDADNRATLYPFTSTLGWLFGAICLVWTISRCRHNK